MHATHALEAEANAAAHDIARIRPLTGVRSHSPPPGVGSLIQADGHPLEPAVRSRFEARLGHDFGNVRIHTDVRAASSAHALQAEAYTFGQHIAFSTGRYAPSTIAGADLLAHELAHTVQQDRTTGFVQRRRVPTAQELEQTLHEGGPSPGAYILGVTRLIERAWGGLTDDQKARVRQRAATFSVTGTTDAELFYNLVASAPSQIRQFADAIRQEAPNLTLGDPALYDTGPRPGTEDANNIKRLVRSANKFFQQVASGVWDRNIRVVFGASNVAVAKRKFANARAALNKKLADNQILTDRSGYASEIGLRGLGGGRIFVEPETIDKPELPISIVTVVHESMHAGNNDVKDEAYEQDPAFRMKPTDIKLVNASHFGVIAFRALDPEADGAFDDLPFVPAGQAPMTEMTQVLSNTRDIFRQAWTAGIHLHTLWVLIFQNPSYWINYDLSTASSFAPLGAKWSETLPYWSKVEGLTVHSRLRTINPQGSTMDTRPVTPVDIALSEGLTRTLGEAGGKTPTTDAEGQQFIDTKGTDQERKDADVSASVTAKTSVLEKLVLREYARDMTGPPERDQRVVDRMAESYRAGYYNEYVIPRSPSTFPD